MEAKQKGKLTCVIMPGRCWKAKGFILFKALFHMILEEKDIVFYSRETAKRLGDLLPHSKINVIVGAEHALIGLVDNINENICEI